MDFQSLKALYANKTDEELLELGAQFDQLTFESQSALSSEMGERRLSLERVAATVHPAPLPAAVIESSEAPPRPVPVLPVGEFIVRVLLFYHEHLWLFFKPTFLAVLVGMLSIRTAGAIQLLILRPRVYGARVYGNWYRLGEGFLVSTVGFLVSWMAFCFAFAAICVAVRTLRTGSDMSGRATFQGVSTKLSRILRVSVLLFTVFYTGVLATAFILFVPLGRLATKVLNAVPYSAFATGFVVIMAVSLATSRLGLAIPAVVLDDSKVSRAFFRSDELTEKKWSILAVLLTKSIIGGYIAGMLPFWLAGWIPVDVHIPSWFFWILTGASVVLVTYVEPILFIGLALLCEETNSTRLLVPHEPALKAWSG